jgi:hypothetical protein
MYVVKERFEFFQLHANNFAVRMVDFLKISFTFQVSYTDHQIKSLLISNPH